jgi:hypothetical protein
MSLGLKPLSSAEMRARITVFQAQSYPAVERLWNQPTFI